MQAHFAQPEVRGKRAQFGLPTVPTDVEMEIIAQTWSEHCKHKIFGAEIDYTEELPQGVSGEGVPALGTFTVKSVFKSYIARPMMR